MTLKAAALKAAALKAVMLKATGLKAVTLKAAALKAVTLKGAIATRERESRHTAPRGCRAFQSTHQSEFRSFYYPNPRNSAGPLFPASRFSIVYFN